MRIVIILIFLGTLVSGCSQEKKFDYNNNWWGMSLDNTYHEIYLLDSIVFVNDSRNVRGYPIISINKESLSVLDSPWKDTLTFDLSFSGDKLLINKPATGFGLVLYKSPIPVRLPSLSSQYYNDTLYQDHRGISLRKELFIHLLENNLLGTQPLTEHYIIR
jgi:hypothetical protein